MSTHLDMSLEDVIKSSRGGNRERIRERVRNRRGGGRGTRGSFSGGAGRRMVGSSGRRGPLSVNAQPSPFTIAKSFRRPKTFPWQHDLFEDSIRASGITGIEIGTKLYVSNLEYGVTNEDIRELFSEIGDLKRYAVHYNKTGRSSGSAEVVYTRRSDAFAAVKRYNNVLLDGKPMKIEIVGANSEMPISARVSVAGAGANGRKKRTVVMAPRLGGVGGSAVANRGSGVARFPSKRGGGAREGRARGGGSGMAGAGAGRGRGRGRARGGRGGRKKPVEKSADDLDKDLDKYHAEAMQT